MRGAGELRAKETDRLAAASKVFAGSARTSEGTPDGFRVRGVPTRLRGGAMDSRGDHRIAMLAAVAGLASREGVRVDGADAVDVSFPGFFDVLRQLSLQASET